MAVRVTVLLPTVRVSSVTGPLGSWLRPEAASAAPGSAAATVMLATRPWRTALGQPVNDTVGAAASIFTETASEPAERLPSPSNAWPPEYVVVPAAVIVAGAS